jgi:hypothetical protein
MMKSEKTGNHSMNNAKNNNFMLIASIFITCILILTVLYYTFNVNGTGDEEEDTINVFTLDDRISPLTNQGLVLEVLRIRHRGLLDEIVKRGTSWKTQPRFYFISNIDGQEYISKDIEGAGGVLTEIPFEGWDTIFQENKIMRDSDEEQARSHITLTLMEMQTSGLLGRKTTNVEKDTIEIEYDFKTGHWSGDDYLKDKDGYGHYLGDTFEVWFNVYPIDYDGDHIPYWTEVNVYGTNPQVDDRYLDPDNDGIPTSWEWKYGYDPMTWDNHRQLDPDVDGIDNIEEYQISKWFSDPFSTDIYIEVDGMEKTGFLDPAHYLYKESIQILIERFAQNGFNVYIDDGWPAGPINGGGEFVRHVETLSQDAGQFLQYYNNNFADERKGVFRYCIIGHNTGFSHPSESNKVDCLTADTSLKKLIRRYAFTPRTQRLILASATLHELGHSLGIHSWTFHGVDSGGYGNLDYQSIMNYEYIFKHTFILDYSHGENGAPDDQDDWSIIYPPHFQDVDVAIEEPYFYKLEDAAEYIVDEEPEPILPGWMYDENLTEMLQEKMNGLPTFYFKDYLYRAYVRVDENNNQSNRDFRFYIKANIAPTYTTWVLISEGELDEEQNIMCYSFQDKIEQISNEEK